MKRKLIAGILTCTLMLNLICAALPIASFASDGNADSVLIEDSDIPLRLYYDEEASHGVSQGYDNVSESFGSGNSMIAAHPNDDWERWSIPLGNGYFGANIFGRTETERIQITEKTLANPYYTASGVSAGGLNNFSETYIDFGHSSNAVTNYSRDLDLKTAVSGVQYTYGGVTYTREYFTSYPDNAMVIKLTASEAGALDFVLRPTVPYEQEYMNTAGDGVGKTGSVTSAVDNGVGTVTLSGTLEYYDVDFVGLYRVVTDGTGTVSATTCTNSYGDTDGTITVAGATSAYIVITLGTDYVLSEQTFLSSNKPTQSTTLEDAMEKVEGYMAAITAITDGLSFDKAYTTLKERHIADYGELFGRVSLNLNCDPADFELTTDELLTNYKNGNYSTYLEVLYFQYGRYLLIASSRSGALPANLQGTWNRYNQAPWSSGYWHNINVQMNYWPAFSTNLAETFEAYAEYNDAYMAQAEAGATSDIRDFINKGYIDSSVLGKDGGNGWSIDTGAYPYVVYGHQRNGIGNLGFTTQIFWDYYLFSGDEALLRETVYPILASAARYITKVVALDENGEYYLAVDTDSPEQYVDGVWYYTNGTTYAQTFAFLNNYYCLEAARELGIDLEDEALLSTEEYSILKTVMEQLDKYDPIVIGLSGQIKEFREEEYYSDLGEATHRHISHLVGLYPGTLINSTTPAWLDAAKYVLEERGDNATGWGVAHRLNLWARTKDGDRTYELVKQLLSKNTATNLWDLHPPFQIDGNLGGTAGISEMLLQSHEGYIAPLSAIPTAWASGSYNGLVARGDFEVSAAWADGVAKTFNILSNDGGTARVGYSGIAGATVVRASDGKAVSFTKESADLIAFETEAGETYIISGFANVEKPDAVSAVEVYKANVSTSVIKWNASADAVSYNVYYAKDNDADYTLIGSTAGTTARFTAGLGEENARYTFAVTAVSADGIESDRALCYLNPIDTVINEVGVKISEDASELQVTVNASPYAAKYKLFSCKGVNDAWTLVTEGGFPILIDKSFNKDLTYGISVVDYFGEETEIQKIMTTTGTGVDIEYNSTNILEGLTFTPTTDAAASSVHATGYGYEKLTDRDFVYNTGRFSTKNADTVVFDGTLVFPATFMLSELRIHSFNDLDQHMGKDMKIEVKSSGKWITVYDLASNAEIVAHKSASKYYAFDLGCIRAEAIRISCSGPVSGTSISIEEIECSGVLAPSPYVYDSAVLNGVALVPTAEAQGDTHNSGDYGYEKLTDGNFDPKLGRFSTNNGSSSNPVLFDATATFDTTILFNELRMYDFASENAGASLVIQVGNYGKWTTVIDCATNAEILTHRKTVNNRSCLVFDLGCTAGQQLRIYIASHYNTASISFYEIECDGFTGQAEIEASDNLLDGLTFTPSSVAQSWVHATGYGYDKLTDRDFVYNTGRFSTKTNDDAYFEGTVTLPYTCGLSELRIYAFNAIAEYLGKSMKIEVLSGSEWITVYNLASNSEIAAHKSTTARYYTFDMGGTRADAIRITIDAPVSGHSISIEEIECTGFIEKSSESYPEIEDSNILLGTTADKVTVSGTLHPSTGKVDVLFDGKTGDESNAARIATLTKTGFTIDIDLSDEKALHTLRIYDWRGGETTTRSDKTNVYVYSEGIWLHVIKDQPMTTSLPYTAFDLSGIRGTKIRISFDNTLVTDGSKVASIKEISLTVGDEPLVEGYVDRTALLAALNKLPGADTMDDISYNYLYNDTYAKFYAYAQNVNADQETVDAYAAEIEKFCETVSDATLSAYNISLEGDIKLNFRYIFDTEKPLEKYPDAYVEFAIPQKDGSYVTERVYLKDTVTDDAGRYIFSVALAAAQMNDAITFKMVYADGLYGETHAYSVRSYADYVFANADMEKAYPGLTSLLKAMLNYGAYAQQYFEYKTEELANDGIYTATTDPVLNSAVTDSSEIAVDGTATGIAHSGWRLSCISSTTIKLFFETEDITAYTFTLTTPDGDVALTAEKVGERYLVTVDGVTARDLDYVYTLKVTNSADGSTMTVRISAMCYVASVLANADAPASLVNLVKAMKLYNDAADGYLS